MTDFKDAANRHWFDAEILFNNIRLANADHLFGLAAECALKAVMQALGMKLSANDKPEAPYGVHINKLWDQIQTFITGRGGAHYLGLITVSSNPFLDWDINQRYHHQSTISEASVNNHRQGARTTIVVLNQASDDGFIK